MPRHLQRRRSTCYLTTALSKYAQNAFAIRICSGVRQLGSKIRGLPTRMLTHRARDTATFSMSGWRIVLIIGCKHCRVVSRDRRHHEIRAFQSRRATICRPVLKADTAPVMRHSRPRAQVAWAIGHGSYRCATSPRYTLSISRPDPSTSERAMAGSSSLALR